MGTLPAETLSDYEVGLIRIYGPVLGGSELAKALGFKTPAAFRKAKRRVIPPRVS